MSLCCVRHTVDCEPDVKLEITSSQGKQCTVQSLYRLFYTQPTAKASVGSLIRRKVSFVSAVTIQTPEATEWCGNSSH